MTRIDIPLIILAGGKATRLGALSQNAPKFLMPLHHGKCFADIQLDWVKKQGFRNIILCVGHHEDQIRSYCQRYANTFSIQYSSDGDVPLGTGGAVAKALHLVQSDYFAVMYGDTLLDFDCKEVIDKTIIHGAAGMMTLFQNPPHGHTPNALLCHGLATYSKSHPKAEFDSLDYGFSVFHTKSFQSNVTKETFDLSQLQESLSEQNLLLGCHMKKPFREINTPDALQRLRESLEPGLVILDRDGVINSMVVHPEFGTVDSPLNPDEVHVFPWIPQVLANLNQHGFELAIVTNQPAAAKGKTTLKLLHQVHERIIEQATSAGARILKSFICFHRAEDLCDCRKPQTRLLKEALELNPRFSIHNSWMIGDGLTDIQAGQRLGLNTGFIGPMKCDVCNQMHQMRLKPNLHEKNLSDMCYKLIHGCEEIYNHTLKETNTNKDVTYVNSIPRQDQTVF